MDEIMLLFAGEVGPPVRLAEALRQLHTDAYEAQKKRAAARAALGTPEDGAVHWSKLTALLDAAGAAVNAKAKSALTLALAEAIDVLQEVPHTLDETPAVPKYLEDVELSMASMSEVDKRRIGSRLASHLALLDGENKKEPRDVVAVADLENLVYQAQREIVKLSLRKVTGLKRRGPNGEPVDAGAIVDISDGFLDALHRANAFWSVFAVCDRFQSMPPGKAARFGLPPQ